MQYNKNIKQQSLQVPPTSDLAMNCEGYDDLFWYNDRIVLKNRYLTVAIDYISAIKYNYNIIVFIRLLARIF